MFGRLMPREARFFDLFNQHAERIVEGAGHLVELMQRYDDEATRQAELEEIDRIENSADKIAHETFALLHKTFITPFDREDIHQRSAVALLTNRDNAEAILKLCTEIDQLESDADRVMRSAMSKLFRDESDVRTVIKMKAIYELLESLTDKCEDVANILEGVVLENA
jgi:uncharacterized protein Yka (UPF0111/DUF47 family)